MAGHHHLDDLLDRLRADGARITPARRQVLQTIDEAGSEHLTADQIASRIHQTSPDLHVSTIYRTLDFLEESRIVIRAGFGDGAATYHLAADRHHHAVCEVCGAVIELPDRTFTSVINRLQKDHGFIATPRHLTITGRCRRCAAR